MGKFWDGWEWVVDIWVWFTQLQGPVQAAVITSILAIITLIVTQTNSNKSHAINKENLKINVSKESRENKKLENEERERDRINKIEFIDKMDSKKEEFAILIKKILELNDLTPDKPNFYNKIKILTDNNVSQWCDEKKADADNKIEEFKSLFQKTFNNHAEKSFLNKYVAISTSHYSMIFGIINSYYSSLQIDTNELPAFRSAKTWNYIKEILKVNNEVICFLENCLPTALKNINSVKNLNEIGLNDYISGDLPFSKNYFETIKDSEQRILSEKPCLIDFTGYEKYEYEEKIQEYRIAKINKNKSLLLKLFLEPIIYETLKEKELIENLENYSENITSNKFKEILSYASRSKMVTAVEKIPDIMWNSTYQKILRDEFYISNYYERMQFVESIKKNKKYREKVIQTAQKIDNCYAKWILEELKNPQ